MVVIRFYRAIVDRTNEQSTIVRGVQRRGVRLGQSRAHRAILFFLPVLVLHRLVISIGMTMKLGANLPKSLLKI